MIRHIIWDWNGTLFDDAPLSWMVTREMLIERGKDPLTFEAYVSIMGHPYEEAYRKAGFVYTDEESYADLARIWAEGYERGWKDRSLRAGAQELLRDLKERGISQSILTAAREKSARMQMEYLGVSDCFCLIQGVENDLAEGKEQMALAHRDAIGVPAHEILLVGDTAHDAHVADAIGCECVLLRGGHMDEARLRRTGKIILWDMEALRRFIGERI